MGKVKRLCNEGMNFFPQAVAMCIHGDNANPRVYTYRIGEDEDNSSEWSAGSQ